MKSLYDLKQASIQWFGKLFSSLKKIDFLYNLLLIVIYSQEKNLHFFYCFSFMCRRYHSCRELCLRHSICYSTSGESFLG